MVETSRDIHTVKEPAQGQRLAEECLEVLQRDRIGDELYGECDKANVLSKRHREHDQKRPDGRDGDQDHDAIGEDMPDTV